MELKVITKAVDISANNNMPEDYIHGYAHGVADGRKEQCDANQKVVDALVESLKISINIMEKQGILIPLKLKRVLSRI